MPAVPQGPGGIGAPPGSFNILSFHSTIQVYGAGDVRDAVTCTVQDNIYGIIFSFTIPRQEWDEQGPQLSASEYASVVQAIAAMQEVIGVGYTQEPSASGLLLDRLLVTITDPKQIGTVDVEVPLSVDNPQIAVGEIDKAYKTLLANLGE